MPCCQHGAPPATWALPCPAVLPCRAGTTPRAPTAGPPPASSAPPAARPPATRPPATPPPPTRTSPTTPPVRAVPQGPLAELDATRWPLVCMRAAPPVHQACAAHSAHVRCLPAAPRRLLPGAPGVHNRQPRQPSVLSTLHSRQAAGAEADPSPVQCPITGRPPRLCTLGAGVTARPLCTHLRYDPSAPAAHPFPSTSPACFPENSIL